MLPLIIGGVLIANVATVFVIGIAVQISKKYEVKKRAKEELKSLAPVVATHSQLQNIGLQIGLLTNTVQQLASSTSIALQSMDNRLRRIEQPIPTNTIASNADTQPQAEQAGTVSGIGSDHPLDNPRD